MYTMSQKEADIRKKLSLPDNMRLYRRIGNRNLMFNWVGMLEVNGSKRVSFIAPLHVNKVVEMTYSFKADEFTDSNILYSDELMTNYLQCYGTVGTTILD